MRQLLSTLERFGPDQVEAIRQTAKAHRDTLKPFTPAWTFHEDQG
jgi:hypothetical protein